MEKNKMTDDLQVTITPFKYYAEYDESTGQLLSIFSSETFTFPTTYLEIPIEVAEGINSGKIKHKNLVVDVINKKLLNVDINNKKSNLYQIPLKEFSDIENPDILLTYQESTLKISLAPRFGWYLGVSHTVDTPKIHLPDRIQLTFLITAYNDPTTIFDIIKINVADIKHKCYAKKLNVDKFSIFTNKIFEEYLLEL